MKLDVESIGVWVKENRKKAAIYFVLALIFIVVVFGWGISSCGNYFFNRDIDRQKQNVNSQMQNANTVKEEIGNLKRQEFEKQVEVNQKRKELENANAAYTNSKIITNKALELNKAVESANYANSSVQRAQEALCKAFPEDCR